MLNASFIQGFELDDYHPLAPLHSNSLVLPAMLAAASHVGRVPGERFLLGAILGYETGPRVGQALGGLDMLSRGWHSGVVFGTISAAAAAGTLYGLDAAGFEDAFGMAASQSCGLMSAMYESMYPRRRPRNTRRRVHRVRVRGVYRTPPSGGGPHAEIREDVIRP
jgi:aconitate decarboxylase